MSIIRDKRQRVPYVLNIFSLVCAFLFSSLFLTACLTENNFLSIVSRSVTQSQQTPILPEEVRNVLPPNLGSPNSNLEHLSQVAALDDTYLAPADQNTRELVSTDKPERSINPSAAVRGLNGRLTTEFAGQSLLTSYGIGTGYRFSGSLQSRNIASLVYVDDAPSSSRSLKTSNGLTSRLLTLAYSQTGKQYAPKGISPETGFDNTGFVSYIYSQAGIRFTKKTVKDILASGKSVTRNDLRPGDLLVYQNPRGQEDKYILGIYTGNGNFLLASTRLNLVTETAAFGTDYGPYFMGGRRYFDDLQAAPLSESDKMVATNGAVKQALSDMGDSLPTLTAAYKSTPKKKTRSTKSRKKAKKK
ncbi:MAG: C40 family peptidase [Deltaproteobacteria bacterium]|jgi:hypothetical protein|nr:C40 family peptidase [Deltaproteobacteria bacterium]